MDSIGHLSLEAFANPAQARKTGASYADPNALNSSDNEQVTDRYIPAGIKEEYGIYSKDSLLSGAQPGETVDGLDETEKQMIKELEQSDRKVRQHEQQHVAAAGEFAKGSPSYVYQLGPDGKMYAIGGSVEVDISSETDPGKALRKANMLKAAAMGVDDQSAADARVASKASSMLAASFSIIA